MCLALFISRCLLLKECQLVPENLKEKDRELLVGVRYFVVAIRKQLKPRGKWQYLVNMKKEKQEIGGRELLDRLTVCK